MNERNVTSSAGANSTANNNENIAEGMELANEENEVEQLSTSFSSSTSSSEPIMYALLSEEDLQHNHTTRQSRNINNNNNSHIDIMEHNNSLSYHQINAMMLYYLLHMLDILLQGRDNFTCSAEERRLY